MPLHQTLAAFLAALLLAFAAAAVRPRLKRDLRRPVFWLALGASGALLGSASALVRETAHAGTGFVTRQGWPKPFRFDFVGELGERSTSFEPLYFTGNALFSTAVLLAAWTVVRLLRASGGSVPPET